MLIFSSSRSHCHAFEDMVALNAYVIHMQYVCTESHLEGGAGYSIFMLFAQC